MSKLINVTFIDITTGMTLGIYEVPLEQLPQSFEVATTLNMGGSDWSIEDAEPKMSEEFIATGELTLKMRQLKKVKTDDILFSLPTISGHIPTDISKTAQFNDFIFTMHEDNWHQYEFLNKSSFPLIDLEIDKIKEVKTQHTKTVDKSLTAFTKCHLRTTINTPDLNIDLNKLKELLNATEVGSFALKGYEGFVPASFALKTGETTYYGILKGDEVVELSIADFSEHTINEIKQVVDVFEVVFVDWCNCEVIGAV
ncbi:hypothetical protein [Microscilla marina]|uniref:Uncharacterized protein n=1 Tax=Microscilla marina ATCC 23134 TaxID=313606 RepID=A1ZDY6_MICM2|nr:hypothetical protein [Microscilla marina]EAY31294.1 hypothetical protein M23134_04127 [Microscilla marina ATCC 23134]